MNEVDISHQHSPCPLASQDERVGSRDLPPDSEINVIEVFRSIQGEGILSGELTAFVRLAGCNLKCSWCDTPHAMAGGARVTVPNVTKTVLELGCPWALVTGGEPLIHECTPELVSRLQAANMRVAVCTNGTLSIEPVLHADCITVDYKLGAACAAVPFESSNFDLLRPHDELKFVIANRRDYEEALAVLASIDWQCHVVFSPVMDALQLATWIIGDAVPVRFSVQLHKLIGFQ